MNVIAKELLKKSNLGLKWRVGLGAFLSIGDMITDIFVIRDYMNNGVGGLYRHDPFAWRTSYGRFHLLALVHSGPVASLRCAFILLHEH
ncbi:hypothetical protein ScalyP_jg11803 [Parmales sp. scaly parma]|nr:hypothetical protein ScalyP_jg11803 [Parmales sp. scaly parma]